MDILAIRKNTGFQKPLFGVLIRTMRNCFIFLFSVVLMLGSPWAYSNPGYQKATELTGRVVRSGSGAGIPNVTVHLLGPDYVGMDVTSTNKEGRYTIDLSVLEDKELANLRTFFLQTEERGHSKKRIKLGNGLKLKGTTIRSRIVRLPLVNP